MSDLLQGVRTLGIVCTQWGDTGKGKFVDYFAEHWADVIARGTGGANAGHTVKWGNKEFVFHLLPSGMLHKKLNVIGSGVAVEPGMILDETAALKKAGISLGNLKIALNARLVLPQHVVLDRVREASGKAEKLGTTGLGMGPAYTDHVARLGLIVNDLLNPKVFREKLRRNLEEKIRLIKTYDSRIVRTIMHQDIVHRGEFYHPKNIFDAKRIAKCYLRYGKALAPFIADTDAILRGFLGKKKILLEGAQGNMLSVDYGTYPYVTSSDCSIQGLAKGVGLHEQNVDLTFGIVKAFYMTRVGEGPFPTELGGERSAEHARHANRETEAWDYPCASINDPDEFVQGIAIRQRGSEYGATTGRPRRTGWLDLPLVRYSAGKLTGPNVILTKLDVLDGISSFKVCDEYEYVGPNYVHGGKVYKKGDRIRVAIPDLEIMKYCKPRYIKLRGWKGPISSIRTYAELPVELRKAILVLERKAGVNVSVLSVGPDRKETIYINIHNLH